MPRTRTEDGAAGRRSRRAKAPQIQEHAQARPGDPGPGLQGADLHEGSARHRAGLARGPLPGVHAVRVSRRREPQDRRTRRAAAAARAGAGGAPGGFRRRDRAHRRRGCHPGDLPPRTRSRCRGSGRRSSARRTSQKAPSLVHRETSLTRGLIRDVFSAKVERCTVDSKQVYNEIIEYLKAIAPELIERVKLYEEHGAALRQSGGRAGDPRPLQAALRPAGRRLPDHRADGGARVDRRELGPLHGQEGPREDDPAARTSRRRARSRGSSGCATLAASSSATSSTWRRGRTATKCCRSSASTCHATARAPRRSR